MLKTSRILFLSLILLSIMACEDAGQPDPPSLIPAVNQYKLSESGFLINPETKLLYSNEIEDVAILCNQLLQERLGFELEMTVYKSGQPEDNSILLNKIDGIVSSEQYTLSSNKDRVWITSDGKRGLVHAVYTLCQLIDQSDEPNAVVGIQLEDHPRFGHRGLLLDCARHYMSTDYVKKTIDQLAYYKMNVLHWHLTEDQGWRIEIDAYPELTNTGAWRTESDGSRYGGFYTKEEIREIVEYAEQRAVTIIPEIELPGHSSAAIASYPWLSCTGEQIPVETEWGVFQDIYCAGNDSVFAFLETVLDEVVELFPSQYIHIGGDEAPKTRWEECPKCQKRIQEEGLHDEHELQSYFISRVATYLKSKGKQIIGWDEILEGGIPSGAIVQSWRGMDGGIEAVKEGHQVVMSPTSHAYLDYDLKSIDLRKVYSFDPIPPGLNEGEEALILGAECNMWSERVTEETVDQKIYPRMIAMAEVLWSSKDKNDYENFVARLRSHYPMLRSRGVNYGAESEVAEWQTLYRNDSLFIALNPGTPDVKLFYSPGYEAKWLSYEAPVYIAPNEKKDILIRAELNGEAYGDTLEIDVWDHKAVGGVLQLDFTYSPYYPAGGSDALIDGELGSLKFRDGRWQALQGGDMDLTVDLGQIEAVETVSANFYQYGNAWIFLPKKVEFYFSKDGENWQSRSLETPDSLAFLKEQFTEEYVLHSLVDSCRYVRMRAVNFGVNPEWHDAPGMESWLFCDELVVN